MTVFRNIGYHLTPKEISLKRNEKIQKIKFNVDPERKEGRKHKRSNCKKEDKGKKDHQENNDSNSSKIDIYI